MSRVHQVLLNLFLLFYLVGSTQKQKVVHEEFPSLGQGCKQQQQQQQQQ